VSAGTRVATGRLRVDAARAVDKLREYQLPDPTAWVLEVVRAAVAFGATGVEVTGDADDVRVAWDGDAPDAATLADLFDELVDPAPRIERRPVRLLATGVNTALGLSPRWVDVTVTDGEGGAFGVRYTPRLFETRDGTAERLRALSAEPRVPPPGAPARGGLVHLKRLPLLDAVPLMVGYGEPRELSILRRSADDSRVPVRVGGSTIGRETSHSDLLRVGLGDGLDGFLALVEPAMAHAEPRLEAAELGVVLARYSLPTDALPEPRAAVPLRMHVNADRMPTNASRSAVRLDESPLVDAIERLPDLLSTLIEKLVEALADDAAHGWPAARRERLRAAAIQLLACHAAGEDWRARLLRHPNALLAPLLSLELLRDALGRPRSASSFGLGVIVERVHFGADPLPAELEPWLGDSLWVPPGDPARALLGAWTPYDAKRLAKMADRHRARRRAFARSRPREPKLEARVDDHLLVLPVRAPGKSLKTVMPAALFEVDGLDGELALRDRFSGDGAGISVLMDGREIEAWAPVAPLDGVITCAGLTPRVDYEGLERDDACVALHGAVRATAVCAYEALAQRFEGKQARGARLRHVAGWIDEAEGPDAERVAATLRDGVIFTLRFLTELSRDADAQGARDDARRTLRRSRSPLLGAEIWPRVGGGYVSTRALLHHGTSPPSVVGYYLGRPIEGWVPDGRPVVCLSLEHKRELQSYLPGARFVDYGRALTRPPREPQPGALARAILPTLGVASERVEDGRRVAVAWGGLAVSQLEVRHWGVRVATQVRHEIAPAIEIVVDDPHVVPDEALRQVMAVLDYPLQKWADELAVDYADALIGKGVDRLHLGDVAPVDATRALDRFLRWIADAESPAEVLGASRWARLTDVPMVSRLGRSERESLREVAEGFGRSSIEWIDAEQLVAVELEGWHPIHADREHVAAFSRLLRRNFSSGEPQLARLRRAAARNQALARHRARPEVDPSESWTGARVEVKGRGVFGGAATLAPIGAGARVQVLIEGRPFAVVRDGAMLPIDAYVDLSAAAADEDFSDLTQAGVGRARHAIYAGARGLLEHVAAQSPTALTRAPEVRHLLFEWARMVQGGSGRGSDQKTRRALARAPAYPTIQGGHAAMPDAATSNGTLRLARWDEEWLDPAPGDARSTFDDPVLRLSTAEPHRAALRTIWAGPTRDVTGQVARLQAERRVARGLMQRPRLEGRYDPRFRFAVEDLLDEAKHAEPSRSRGASPPSSSPRTSEKPRIALRANDFASFPQEALEILGFGEVALTEGDECVVTYHDGPRRRVVCVRLVPPVHVACHSPSVSVTRGADEEVRRSTERALEVLIGLVVRAAVDATPGEELPPWLRRELRRASLSGGPLHLERLSTTPMFETTTGGWVTPDQLLAQGDRYAAVWATSSRQDLEPLDPERIAVRLDAADQVKLSKFIACVDATEPLELDAQARANMQRPPVKSLEPSEDARADALGVISLEATATSEAHGSIVLLPPGRVDARALRLSRSFHPFDADEDPSPWPALAQIDDPALTPGRTWARPEDDEALRSVRLRVRSAVDAELLRRFPFPTGKLAAARVRSIGAARLGLPESTSIEGITWLELDDGPGTLRVLDPSGERTVAAIGHDGQPLPVHAELWSTLRLGEVRRRRVCDALHATLHASLARRLGAGTAPDAGRGLERLCDALAVGVEVEPGLLEDIELTTLSGLAPNLAALREHVAQGGFVSICSPRDEAEAEAASLGTPRLVDDGGAVSRALLRMLGSRAEPWRDSLRAQLLGGVEADARELIVEEQASGAPAPRAPASPLAEAVRARWQGLSLPSLEEVRVDGRRRRPAAAWTRTGHLRLAGKHPAVRRAGEAIEAGAPSADRQVALLVAAAIGALRTDERRLGAHSELAALTALMRALARQ